MNKEAGMTTLKIDLSRTIVCTLCRAAISQKLRESDEAWRKRGTSWVVSHKCPCRLESPKPLKYLKPLRPLKPKRGKIRMTVTIPEPLDLSDKVMKKCARKIKADIRNVKNITITVKIPSTKDLTDDVIDGLAAVVAHDLRELRRKRK